MGKRDRGCSCEADAKPIMLTSDTLGVLEELFTSMAGGHNTFPVLVLDELR